MHAIVILLLSFAPASAWILRSQDYFGASLDTIRAQLAGSPNWAPQAQLSNIWSAPLDGVTSPLWSLGGGITWAWDSALCDQLIFSEGANCDDAKAALDRAFNRWAGNNRNLHFLDVTKECDERYRNDAGPLVSAPANVGYFHNRCPIAEIYVSILNEAANGRVAVARQYADNVRAYADAAMVFTNGARPFDNTSGTPNYDVNFYAVYAGSLEFDVAETCWYLDSSFCSGWHVFKDSVGGADAGWILIAGISWALTVIAFICLISMIFGCQCCCKSRAKRDIDRDGDGQLSMSERLLFFVEEISTWNPLVLSVLVALVFAPPLVLHLIIQPCWECYDFEAAAVHEIGHILGLGHPDQAPDGLAPDVTVINPNPMANQSYSPILAAGGRSDASNCYSLWDSVEYGVPPNLPSDQYTVGVNGYTTRVSAMLAFTQHNPRACLENDDFEALQMMYPDCSVKSLAQNVCHRVNHNIGLVRVMLYLLLPMLISLVVIVCLSGIASWYLNRELEESREHAETIEAELKKHMEAMKRGAATRRTSTLISALSSRRCSTQVSGSSSRRDMRRDDNDDDDDIDIGAGVASPRSRAHTILLNKRAAKVVHNYTFPEGPLGLTLKHKKNGQSIISEIEPGGTAESLGVQVSGKIVEVNKTPVPKGGALAAIKASPRPMVLTIQYKKVAARKSLMPSASTVSSFGMPSSASELTVVKVESIAELSEPQPIARSTTVELELPSEPPVITLHSAHEDPEEAPAPAAPVAEVEPAAAAPAADAAAADKDEQV